MKVHSARWLRRLRRLLGVCFVLLLLALTVVFALLHNLERDWVRARLVALALASSGLEISYGAVDLHTWSELDVRDLVVRSPLALRSVAPELLRVGRLRLCWWRMPPFGQWPTLREVDIEQLRLDVARDEHGQTSFDAIPNSGSATPPPPLSRMAQQFLGSGFPVPKISVHGMTLALIQTEHGTARERDTVRDLTLNVEAAPEAGGARLELSLGKANAPLELRVDRSATGMSDTSATARAFLVASVSPSQASAVLDVRVTGQDLVPQLAVEQLVHLEAKAKFEPSAGRVELAIAPLSVADDSATSQIALELPDRGALRVKHAAGELDAARLLRLAAPWLPGIALSSGTLRYRVDDFALDQALATTAIAVDATLLGVHVPLSNGSLSLASARLTLNARPNGVELGADGSARLDGVEFHSKVGTLRGRELAFQIDGRRAKNGAISGQSELRFASLALDGASPAIARAGRIGIHARDVQADLRSPLSASGEVQLDAEVSSLEAGAALRYSGSNLKLHAETPLAVHERWAVSSNFSAERLQLARAGHHFVALPFQGVFAVRDLSPDLQRPERSSGAVHATLDVGGLHTSLDATQREQTVDYTLSAFAKGLGDARAFAPDGAAQELPWERMAFELESKGKVSHVTSATPELEQRARLHLTGAALETVSARALTCELQTRGGLLRHRAELDLAIEGLHAAGAELGNEHLTASLELDRARPSLQFGLTSERLAKTDLQLSAAFDREQQAVTYRANGRLSALAPLGPVASRIHALAGFELSKLALQLNSQGHLDGVISGARADGSWVLAPRPLSTAKLSASLELGMSELTWADGDRALSTPAATLRATLDANAEQRTVHSDFAADEIGFGLGRHRLRVTGLHDQSVLRSTGPLAEGGLELEQHASIAAVEQNFAPMYRVGEVRADVHVRREPNGLIRVDDIQIDNRAAGTTLRVRGGVDLGDDLRRLSLRATIAQDLSRVSNRRELFTGSGNALMSLSVDSPDFRVFHSSAELKLEHAQIRLPAAKIALDGIEGDVPVVVDVTYGRKGVELLRGERSNPYATLRFADQHPLRKNHSFISIARLTSPFVTVAPFAANLEIEQNIVSLSQLEMGVRGGSITGDGVFDWNGAQSSIQADLRATGVLSSHGEPFDGNAALLVDIGDRSIDGRADILRIGPRHLLDLLDLQDPEHESSGMNRIRTALHFGYPERVRLAFKHGFASAGVSFGGLASLISIDDVRGIPIGPLLERVVNSFYAEAEQ